MKNQIKKSAPSAKQVAAWVELIGGLKDEAWKTFFKKVFPDLSDHLHKQHQYLSENSSPYAVKVSDKDLGKYLKSTRQRPGIYSPFIATDDGRSIIPNTPSKAKDRFMQSQKKILDFGFSSIGMMVGAVPKLNRVLARKGLKFCVFVDEFSRRNAYVWIEKKNFGDGPKSLARPLSKRMLKGMFA